MTEMVDTTATAGTSLLLLGGDDASAGAAGAGAIHGLLLAEMMDTARTIGESDTEARATAPPSDSGGRGIVVVLPLLLGAIGKNASTSSK
jgi:hypothetical protein